jgi:hypothetical protein
LRTNFRELRSISHWSRVLWDRPLVIGFSICTHNVTLQQANQHSSRFHSLKWSTKVLSHTWFLKEPTFTGKTTKPTRAILRSEHLQSACQQNTGNKQTECSLLIGWEAREVFFVWYTWHLSLLQQWTLGNSSCIVSYAFN